MILVNPRFIEQLDKIKADMKPVEIAELEKALKQIIEKPFDNKKIGDTAFYQAIINVFFNKFIVVYELEKDKMIFWSIE